MQGNVSIFDAASFLETTHSGEYVSQTDYVLPDPGDYPGQITDKIEAVKGVGEDGRPWARCNITWEITDDAQRKKLNAEKVFVRQSFFLDLTPDSTVDNPVLDFGLNKNMAIKRLWKSTGVTSGRHAKAKPTIGDLKFMQALIRVDHEPDRNDPSIQYAVVKKVTSLNGA